MDEVNRRDLLGMSASTLVAASAALSGNAEAASLTDQNTTGVPAVNSIERFGIMTPEQYPRFGTIPIISLSSVHNDIVYLCGLTADADKLGDVKDQTTQILERVDRLLAKNGTNKSKALTAQVWLTDMKNFEAHNEAWNAWVDAKNPPVRMCVLSPQLWHPGMLVEIMVTAAK